MAHEGHDHPHSHSHDDAVNTVEQHRHHSPVSVACSVIVCSDTRDLKDDLSGQRMVDRLEKAGHSIAHRALVKDDANQIRNAISMAQEHGSRCILISGGTGLSSRDVTYETVRPLLEKELPGFGELFRWLSFQQIGSAAMLSRAVAGSRGQSVIFALPGSPQAVELALSSLVLPEIGHMVRELSR